MWERCCIKEAKEDNYIKEKVDKEKRPNFSKNNMVINMSAILFILSLILCCIFVISSTGERWFASLDEFDKYAEEEISELDYRKVRRKRYKTIEVNNRYERIKEGKILVEQIVGIKNYIHDFSLLSEKDKENIVLWEDFLIYAVVLEENKAIIDDIYKYRNINSNVLSNIMNFFTFLCENDIITLKLGKVFSVKWRKYVVLIKLLYDRND